MNPIQRSYSPIDGSLYVERELASDTIINRVLDASVGAQNVWRKTPLNERITALTAMVEAFVANKDDIAEEITRQMGRPLSHSPWEVDGFEDRALTMLAKAGMALADVVPTAIDGFTRFVRREPLGVVLTLAPWNYPYLCAVNAIIPAMAAGNTVVLKHSAQTPLCAERLQQAADAAGLPAGVFQTLHCSHDSVASMVADSRVDYVAFTGSVDGGVAVSRAGAGRFIAMGMELGGKDPAYVRADAKLDHAAPNLVEGAFFNSGQSCCGIERIYVHETIFDNFVERYVAGVNAYTLGDPLLASSDLGPMVRASAADHVRGQTAQALAAGAKALISKSNFAAADEAVYLAPQVLVDVDHSMAIMREESFGPVIGIMKVSGDAEALRLMNDSRYGLTASVWTQDQDAGLALASELETGTVFMNRCDYLDPHLAWVGVKDSGRGCTLSSIGYENLTRPKSFHLRSV
ncbi:MAG: aldehyde dehydrogenase family protein [Myxococcota bacterium]|nr:aldehyde dehydrogenase family protein [Myxococcota bacterium]